MEPFGIRAMMFWDVKDARMVHTCTAGVVLSATAVR